MPADPVYANARTIVHAGDGSQHVCAPPDVCKTPTPGGPQPVPYVNVAKSSDLAKGTKQTKIAGKSVAIVGAQLRTSTGDEPGSAGGLVSGKTKGKAGWYSGSPNVRFEGKSVMRFMDPCLFNGNTYNSSFKLQGGTGWAYGDDAVCFLCKKSQASHRLLETQELSRKSKGVHAEVSGLAAGDALRCR